ncbi:MAG: peptidoglycan-binding domain-containing protein, partial [Pseudomonadota bacterium]
ADATPVLRQGDNGPAVRRLQRALIAAGERVTADGIFGARTAAALKRVQGSLGLVRDGIAGPMTWKALADSAFADV